MAVKLITKAQQTVTTSGTEIQVSVLPIANATKVFITAPAANTGLIFVGDASVATTRGIEVPKGTTLTLESANGDQVDLQNIWVDAATNGDKFQVSYLQKV